MGTPIQKLQGTEYALTKEVAKNSSTKPVREIINRKGEIVVLYKPKSDPTALIAHAFNKTTGAANNSTTFYPNKISCTTEFSPDGKKLALRQNKELISISNYDKKENSNATELRSVDHFKNNKFVGTVWAKQ